jgi:hypothetical protein
MPRNRPPTAARLAETDDPALERMIQEAFMETMADAENRMEARVRVGDQDYNRTVENMVYAAFVHRETRPIGGIPDPHYHIHAFAMNAVYDCQEQRWKAGQFMNIKADAPFYEAAFNARLASKLTGRIRRGSGAQRNRGSPPGGACQERVILDRCADTCRMPGDSRRC